MENKQNKNRCRKVTIRFTDAEFSMLDGRFRATTKRKLSEYLRAHLLEKKIAVLTRDASLDALVAELIQVRRELNAIGQNFNQAVKRLHAMEHFVELKAWVLVNEKSKELLFQKVGEIQVKIDQIAARW
ncbi:plasmid mobilization protein [Flaviaesturariibacter amylovorans]|uniref:Plasmid mobilization relaxosome protein MobC n=1 Tax=Flaviaesturariibacter amylovorans TaxID=1084520 RepID=A0ABP8HLV3_9BACT